MCICSSVRRVYVVFGGHFKKKKHKLIFSTGYACVSYRNEPPPPTVFTAKARKAQRTIGLTVFLYNNGVYVVIIIIINRLF